MSDQVFRLPDLGEGLTEAEVVRWLVAEGDVVEVDQPVVEVETAKSLVEVPTPYAGTVATRHAPEGGVLEVGKPLLTVAPATASTAASVSPAPAVASAETYREEERAGSGNVLIGYGTSGATAVPGRRRRPRAALAHAASVRASRVPLVVSPLVRKLAREGGVDLRTLDGSGPGGLIVRSDVVRALALPAPSLPSAPAAPAAPSSPGERRIPMTGFRRAVSAALSRSRAEIPEATVWVDVDATRLWELRESTRPGPGLLAYIARFVVAALREYPVFNSRVDTERQEIVELDRIDLGLAVQGARGLVVPAVTDAGALTTTGLDEQIRRVTAAARAGTVTGAGTFTLNNYGRFNVDGSAAIINHPQVAILGFGRIIDRPWVIDGQVCVRKITQMSFVFDHRVADGATAAGFMRSVADAVENPASVIARL
ncbi:dihydrolipoamide acetyltransferase family protein [Paractinoplanes hotanensis]|uniref:Dihydrolipoamide acetyltransferase component of pyruvate dehydrogenase complex n=1 Tax=Paractinoplanes hotanensis TaxID=2906497 RepID=A0ABT0XSQ7_9ACTN|nr:dihydrolipoamide acetyltransferase family protein [Actinoplanes hotanensis]MCM4076263.1 2-oxo acid dehydrogenase subunit E2 [Actinoplanes hotanensis]